MRFLLAMLLVTAACTPALQLTPSDADVVLSMQTLDAPDPGQPGSYDVLTLFYGSGTDKNRPEYRDSVAITTPTADLSKMVDLGRSAEERNEYWGFTPEEMTRVTFSTADVRAAGYSVIEMRRMGFRPKELREGGVSSSV